MTDTPRTLAEVKALLADNTTGQISPQDMRDMVESIVDPVPGGGFGPTVGYDEAALTVKEGQGSLTKFTLTPGQTAVVPLRVIKDPNGWVIPDAFTGSHSVPENSAWLLPPGIYTFSTDFLFTVPVSASAEFLCTFEWTDWDVLAASNDDTYWGAGFYYPAHGTHAGVAETIGVYRQTQAMFDAGVSVCVLAYNGAGVDMVFNYCDVFIVKIA